MTEVIQELQLFDIVQVVQTRLAKNFTILLKRLNRTDQLFSQEKTLNDDRHSQFTVQLQNMQEELQNQKNQSNQTIQSLLTRIQALQEGQDKLRNDVLEGNNNTKRVSDELFTTQLQFQEKIKVKEIQMEEALLKINTLTAELEKIGEQLGTKQSRSEFQRIEQQTQLLKSKNTHFEGQMKLFTHKLQKMQILNQKAERLQAKKEIQIRKEIDQRVKKQLRTMGPIQNTPSSSNISNNGNTVRRQNSMQQRPSIIASKLVPDMLPSIPETGKIREKRELTESSEEGDKYNELNNRSSTFQEPIFSSWNEQIQLILGRWGDRLKILEQNVKEAHENLKILNKQGHSRSRPSEQKQSNSDGIRDKVNQLKPEMVKLWAKLDTIQDRLGFNQRKMEERIKTMNELTMAIKENNSSKLQEKLKNLQTQLFTNLKQIKNKLEGKVNQTDYDKHSQSMDERLKQVHDLIYLKSDKLQVKKALLFLESKIKEIILVISQDEQNEKDALLTKKQLKCISCDKDVDKFSGLVSSPKGNWDSLPYKDHPPEILGRFGMTNFGSLSKKLKKLESKDLPVLNKRNMNQSFQNNS